MGRTTKGQPRRGLTFADNSRSPVAYLLVAIVALALYWQVPRFSLGKVDEDQILLPNLEYLAKTATVVEVVKQDAFFRAPGRAFYRPVQNISYLIDAKVGRGRASTFYITNMILHALASCLVLALLRRHCQPSGVPLAASLFFAVNPLFTQAIAWAPGRGDLLMAVFALGALHLFDIYMRSGSVRSLIGFTAATTLAMFSKETAAVLVLLVPLWWALTGSLSEQRRRLMISTALTAIAAAAMIILRNVIITDPVSTTDFQLVNLFSNLRVFPEMAAKLIAPPLLQTMAGFTIKATILGIVVLAGLIVAVVRLLDGHDRTVALFGLAWYGAFLLPGAMYTHRFGSAAYDYLEHRGYVPAIGVVLILVLLLGRLGHSLKPRIVNGATGVVLVVLSFFTVRHVADFATDRTFYDQAIKSNPKSALARANRGQIRMDAGDAAGAIEDYNAVLTTQPNFIVAHFGLGIAYLNGQQYPLAVTHLRRAYELDSSVARMSLLIGNAYIAMNDLDNAATWYRTCYTKANPATDPSTAYESALNLGVAEARRGNWMIARDLFSQATVRGPSQPDAWLNRGVANQNLGNMTDACSDWQRAEQLGSSPAAELRQKNCTSDE